MLVVPNKYVDELRRMPETRLSSMVANVENFQGSYSTIDILLRGNLHTHAIQTKLTPRLGMFVPLICEEIKKAMAEVFPPCEGQWATIRFDTITRLVVREFARISVAPLQEDTQWREIQRKYPENVFRVAIQMRIIPRGFKRLASWILPSTWAIYFNLCNAKSLVSPIVKHRRKMEASGDVTYEKPNDFLQWLMDEAWNEKDGQPDALVHRLLVLALASVHTTSMTAVQALFDLIAYPEYQQPLRAEILQALQEDGGWKKTTLTKLRKMDSFMKESQRLNGPSLLGFKRAVMEPITLSDGVVLPKGIHLVFPVVPIALESVSPHPEKFDGFRYYRERQQPGHANLHQFAMTDKDNMHFGHGKYSCPGRFFATHSIKILLAHLLLDYDLKFPDGATRPKNFCAHEYVFPDPTADILIRKKDVPFAP
ncbi:cytochrome P450 [Lophiotrema nucula]|uniref:Cytochrome P450 n=1 Tax=Lophiotrema nucula TaxID=690887 RepID=A0A6A5ZS01_9PLEO|nr:cytochrome P450 [Lophiotrema nucula]